RRSRHPGPRSESTTAHPSDSPRKPPESFADSVAFLAMAIPAHVALLALAAAPASRVRVASVATDAVTPDAVGRAALVVAAGAQEDVAPRLPPVSARDARIVADPAGWVRVQRAHGVAADPALHVAGVARLGSVTREALRRVRLRFHRVARDEVAPVHEVAQ